METNVTDMCGDQRGASQAVSRSVGVGKWSIDARRGVLLGAVIGAVGGAVARLASGGNFGAAQGLVFGCLEVAASGALLGWWTGGPRDGD
jgi:hypothetical protein